MGDTKQFSVPVSIILDFRNIFLALPSEETFYRGEAKVRNVSCRHLSLEGVKFLTFEKFLI